MRILVHDFAGHPFQVQLSRALAGGGHSVLHLYLKDLPGPKGRLQPSPADPASFRCVGLSLEVPFEKYSLVKRHRAHQQYARKLRDWVDTWQPEVVLSANTPIDVQYALLTACRKDGISFVHWMQDLYCMALRSVLTGKFSMAGAVLAGYFDHLERRVCERSSAVVFITADFETAVVKKGFKPAGSCVIENWAPLDEVRVVPKCNSWSLQHGLADKVVFLYSGTLGLKHRPEILYELAASLGDRPDARVVVVSEGLGRERLEALQRRARLPNLLLFDFQPYAEISEVLGAADVLLAVIDREAAAFAVPSKVLSYLCAGRAVLLAAPPENLAARTLGRAQGGLSVAPEDTLGFTRAARRLVDCPELLTSMAANARRYATEAFDIHVIRAQFEAVLNAAIEATTRHTRYGAFDPIYPRVAAD